jgi:hypothetical protein
VVARTVGEAQALRAPWIFLAQKTGGPSLDADPGFFLETLSWLTPTPRPHVVLLGSPQEPRAIVVARERRIRYPHRFGYLRFHGPLLRSLEIVHGGLMTDGRPSTCQAIIDYLSSLLAEHEVDHVSIDCLPVEHPVTAILSTTREPGARGSTRRLLHWYAALNSGDGTPIVHRSAKTRARLRNYDHRLTRHFGEEISVERVDDAAGTDRFLRCASTVAGLTYQRGLGVGVSASPRWIGMLGSLANLGYLRGYLLLARGDVIAYLLAAAHERRALLIAQGYTPLHRELQPGNFLLRRVLEEMTSEGVETFDFGFGDGQQKREYGTRSIDEQTYHFYSRSVRGSVGWATDRLVGRASAHARRLVENLGLADGLKRRWRSRLQQARDR